MPSTHAALIAVLRSGGAEKHVPEAGLRECSGGERCLRRHSLRHGPIVALGRSGGKTGRTPVTESNGLSPLDGQAAALEDMSCDFA